MRVKKLTFIFVLLWLLPGMSFAQQLPSNAVNPRDLRFVPEVAVALLPSNKQEPVPLPPTEPIAAPSITLAEFEAMAVQCNPTLLQASARIQSAHGQSIQSGLYPNPVVGYQGSEIGNEGRAGQQGGFVGQEIVTANKLQWNRTVAEQAIRQAECAYSAQRFRVITDVRRGFYEVLVAQRSQELSEQLVRLGEQGVQAAEELLKAKEIARVDVLQAKIEADSARILMEKAKNRHLAAWRELTAIVGNPSMQPAPLAGDLREGIVQLEWEPTLNRLLAESPELASARVGVAHAQAVLCRENAGRVPNVDLQAGVQFDNATGSTIAGFQVGVPMPVYNRNQGNIYKAQAELTAAQREVERVQLALQQRLATVFERYATARQQVEKYHSDILPNAQESLRLVSEGFRQGEFGYLVLLTTQRTYFQTNLAYLDSLRDLRTAGAAIEGNLLTDSLQTAEMSSKDGVDRNK